MDKSKKHARFDDLIHGAAEEDHLMVEVIKEDNHKIIAMAREIIRLREANERLHQKLGETIDECSALRCKLDNALDD